MDLCPEREQQMQFYREGQKKLHRFVVLHKASYRSSIRRMVVQHEYISSGTLLCEDGARFVQERGKNFTSEVRVENLWIMMFADDTVIY